MTMNFTAKTAREMLGDWISEGRLEEILPEVSALRGVQQDAFYHQEGDALAHTLLAVKQVGDTEDERIFWAALLHDIGKVATTHYEDGRWRSKGHAAAGAELVGVVLRRLGHEHLAEDVAWLVRYHMFHLSWGEPVTGGLGKQQKRFCRHPLFPLLVRVARIDAAASLGNSRKGELLERIVVLAQTYRSES